MPLTRKGSKILEAMRSKYGADKGKSVFYASANKGTITGVHKGKKHYGPHHSPPTAAEENAHKDLRNEVAGGLRSMSFATVRQRQPGPPYYDGE